MQTTTDDAMYVALRALDAATSFAAAHVNRLRMLSALAASMQPDEFMNIAGQTPGSIDRDLVFAVQYYANFKSKYEEHCQMMGVAAYATYNED